MSASELTRIRRGVALFNGKKSVLPATMSAEDKLEQTYYGAAPVRFEGTVIKPVCCEPVEEDLQLVLTVNVTAPLARSIRSTEGHAQLHEYIKQRVVPTIRSGIPSMREMRREFAEFRKTSCDTSRNGGNMGITIFADQVKVEFSDGTMLDISHNIFERIFFYAPPGPMKIYASNVFVMVVTGSFDSTTLVPANLSGIVALLISSSDTAWSSITVSDLPELRVLILGEPMFDEIPTSYLTSVSLSGLPSITKTLSLMGDISGVILSGNLLTQAAAEAVAGDLIVNDVSGGTLFILDQYDISGNGYKPVTLDISGNLLTLQNQYEWNILYSPLAPG